MFLIDTDVLSALRRRERHPTIVRWVEGQRTTDLHISVMTIGEIERGITQQQRHNPAFARDLAVWLDRVLAWYGAQRLLRQNRSWAMSFMLPCSLEPAPRQGSVS